MVEMHGVGGALRYHCNYYWKAVYSHDQCRPEQEGAPSNCKKSHFHFVAGSEPDSWQMRFLVYQHCIKKRQIYAYYNF